MKRWMMTRFGDDVEHSLRERPSAGFLLDTRLCEQVSVLGKWYIRDTDTWTITKRLHQVAMWRQQKPAQPVTLYMYRLLIKFCSLCVNAFEKYSLIRPQSFFCLRIRQISSHHAPSYWSVEGLLELQARWKLTVVVMIKAKTATTSAQIDEFNAAIIKMEDVIPGEEVLPALHCGFYQIDWLEYPRQGWNRSLSGRE